MTPGDYYDLVEGYRWRREQDGRDLVTLAWTIAMFERQQKLQPLEKILRPGASGVVKPIEEARADYEELKQRMGRLA